MYTVNVRTQLVYSFTSLALADYITSGNGAGFSTTTSLALCLANSLIQCDNRHPPSLELALGLGREEPDGGSSLSATRQLSTSDGGERAISPFPPAAAPSAPDGAMQAALQIWEAGLKSGRPTAEILDAVRSGQLLGQTSPPLPSSSSSSCLGGGVGASRCAAVLARHGKGRGAGAGCCRRRCARRQGPGRVVCVCRDVCAVELGREERRPAGQAADAHTDRGRVSAAGAGRRGGVAGGLGAEHVHRGVEIYMQTDTFGEGLSVARRYSSSSSPQVVMAYAGIAAAWYGAAAIGWKVDARAFAGYGVVEQVAGAIGTLAKVMEKRDDDCMQMLASSIPLDDECEGML